MNKQLFKIIFSIALINAALAGGRKNQKYNNSFANNYKGQSKTANLRTNNQYVRNNNAGHRGASNIIRAGQRQATQPLRITEASQCDQTLVKKFEEDIEKLNFPAGNVPKVDSCTYKHQTGGRERLDRYNYSIYLKMGDETHFVLFHDNNKSAFRDLQKTVSMNNEPIEVHYREFCKKLRQLFKSAVTEANEKNSEDEKEESVQKDVSQSVHEELVQEEQNELVSQSEEER